MSDARKGTNTGDAPNIETSQKSEKKLKLLCNPQRIPKPPYPKTDEYDETEESAEIKRELREYFWKAKYKKRR